MKDLVTDMAIDDDEVDDLVGDLNDEDAIHLNDGFDDIEDFVNDGVQHDEDNQQHHFDGRVENEGEQHNHFGGPDQENIMVDHNINLYDDVDEDDDHNEINIIHNESSHTSNDTDESFDTTEADPDNTDDLSDEDVNDDPDAITKLNYLTSIL